MKLIKNVNKAKKTIKNIKLLLPFLSILAKFFVFGVIAFIISGFFDWMIEIFNGPETITQIYTATNVTDMKELIQIKKSEDNSGYYLDFVEDINDKVEEIYKNTNHGKNTHNLPDDKEFIKKLIKAEVITQFPNLGGNIPEDSQGFQGTVDIRRVTPNKEIGSLSDNPGRGETSNIEPEISYDTVDTNTLKENQVKAWQRGETLIITSTAKVYAQKESELNPGSDTGSWYVVKKENSSDEDLTIKEGTEVTYTGTYKKNINVLNTSLSKIYVEVKTQEITGYVDISVLDKKEEEKEEETKEDRQERQITSRAKEEEREKEQIIGKKGQEYTIAIAAGHNNTDNKGVRSSDGDLIEEELTIKTAEEVEELLSQYANVKVVQVGSTSSNPGGIKDEERTTKAREANPDLCIQIHFNGENGSGVEAIYKEGDSISRQLAEFLSESMATSMGLPDHKAGSDIDKCGSSLGNIENSISTGFPSVVALGGFIDSDPDAKLLKEDGIDKCAQGIVNGIKKYLVADHAGYTAIDITNQTAQESINSKVYDLKYVEPQELEDLISKANQGNDEYRNQVLKVFTLDENNNLITVTWQTENGGIVYKKNTSMNLKTSLGKYVIPFEYLLYYYIDTKETEFSEKLANEVIQNTEIVIAIQDNITTTKTVESTVQWTEATQEEYQKGETKTGTETTTIEICTPRIEVTYADTWCVKSYKENSYSKKALNWEENEEKELDIKGKVNQSSSQSETSGESIASGTEDIGNDEKVNWTTYQKTKTTIDNMSITYDTGEAKIQGNEHKFIKLYQEANLNQWLREEYLFEILEQDEKTVNLLDLTKYLLFKTTNHDYGKIEFDFNEYNIGNFQSNGGGNYYGTTFEEKVWWALIDAGYSKEAAAGAMGNFQQESEFRSNNLEDKYNRKLGYTDEAYTEAVNNGSYPLERFISDHDKPNCGAGYGLAQWTYCTRKQGLYDLAKSKGVGIDDENVQIEYLLQEMSESGGVFIPSSGREMYNNAQTPEEAADMFFKYFEQAGDSSGSIRQGHARAFYNKYANQPRPVTSGETSNKEGWSQKGVSCPRYYQSDPRWASKPYNYGAGKTIGIGGCGACALAMATSGLLGQDITPDMIVDYLNSINTNTVYHGDKSAQAVANKYGLTYEFISRNNKAAIDAALDSGKVCIFSINANGIYTGGGHFIMCNGREGDKYYVLESGRYYVTDQGYSYHQVFSYGSQGVFVLGK